MRCPSALPNEQARLRSLAQYGLSSERPLPSLDPVVEIALRAFDVPAAAVNMIGRDEVFFAASAGIGDCDMSRDVSFCAHAITQDDVLVIEDARADARFHDNPLVTASAGIRFYAGAPIRSPDGHALGALCLVDSKPHASFSNDDRTRLKELAKLVSDRLELRRLEVASEEGRSRFDRIAHTSPNGIICFNEARVVTTVNPAAEAIFGRAAGEIVGNGLDLILPAWEHSELGQLLAQHEAAKENSPREDYIGRRSDGSEFHLEVAWSAWMEGDEPNFGLVVRDLTDQRRQDDELYRLANFDQITSLPSVNLLHQRLGEELSGRRPTSLLIIGLSGFGDINDTLGKKVRDEILQEVAKRLQNCVRPIDIVARLGSTDFAIMLCGIADPLRTQDVAIAAIGTFAEPFIAEDQEIRIGANCGIALAPSHGSEADELIGSANLALHEARKQGHGHSVFFLPALREKAVARRMFESELYRAVECDELEVYFQPQVRLSDGRLSGAEALLRWNHPKRGLLYPAAFLPPLEASSLALIVGNWVIDTACRQAAAWRKQLGSHFRMSINLFAAQFRSGDLRSFVQTTMERYNLPKGSVELEITETTVLDEEASLLPLLQGLRSDGVHLAFDDFGTGFASLSLLNRYPLTHLKIDKSFVQKATASARDGAIVEAITELAHRLELQVIAEGVETQDQMEFCKKIGCDEVQGFLTGRPVTASHFERVWAQKDRLS